VKGAHAHAHDLASPWRRERMPEMPDTAGFELAPDWIREALSRERSGSNGFGASRRTLT